VASQETAGAPRPERVEEEPCDQLRLREAITEHVAEGLCLLDARGCLTYMNPAAEEILGWREEELRGKVLHDVVHSLHPDGTRFPRWESPLARVLTEGVVIRNREDVWIRKGGELVPVFCSCAPVVVDGETRGAVLSLHEIRERREAEGRLRDALDRYRLLERATNDTIWEWDLVTGEGSWNEGIQTMFGYAPGEVEPTHEWWAERVHPDDRERVEARTRAAVEHGLEAWTEEYRFRRADGSYATVLDRAYIARTPEGRPLRMVGSMLDITARKSLEEQRERLLEAERTARAEAERANQAKSDFLAVMSHELRTPLTAVMGYAELLQMGVPEPVPDSALQQVERIDQAARHLLQLIEEILTFSRLEAEREEVRVQPVELGEVAREAVSFVRPLADRKGLGLSLRAPGAPVQADTDVGKVRQILVNLLVNAVKFTREGEVCLELEPAEAEVSFRVRDTGVGIAPEHLERIFEPFWQAQQGNTRETGGTGLGLTISQRLAALLGGELRAESAPGRGSTFTLRLPR
jgi:PAS domain S-box-containing protein